MEVRNQEFVCPVASFLLGQEPIELDNNNNNNIIIIIRWCVVAGLRDLTAPDAVVCWSFPSACLQADALTLA